MMEMRGKRVLVCNCERTMPLDERRLEKACKAAGAEGEPTIYTQLCRSELESFRRVFGEGGEVMVACTQEAPLFSEVAEEDESEATLSFFNIREKAGWSEGADEASPKIAALAAEAAEKRDPVPTVALSSAGTCLVYGHDMRALEAAQQLKDRLDVTVLLSEDDDIIPPRTMDVPIFKGTVTNAEGHIGKFKLSVRDYALVSPSSKDALVFERSQETVHTECDLILDLSGGTAFFPAAEKREGYLRPDPDDPVAVQKSMFQLTDLVGEFEKPRYVRYQADICAHSRNRKIGCTRCLDVCPTSAIHPADEQVAIDPYICAGCGACAAACPTGAASYQLPSETTLLHRLRTLLGAYREAGGRNPVLLVHDSDHGEEVISMIARFGKGLPANVLPFAVNVATQVGIDTIASALAFGAEHVVLLAAPRDRPHLEPVASQVGLAETVLEGLGHGAGRVEVLDEQDPLLVEERLAAIGPHRPIEAGSFLPMGGKRTRTMLAMRHLHDVAPEPVDHLPLPQGAPFGRIHVDTSGCTMCLACVGACPTGAIVDDPDRPWLGFNEEVCIQCGLCRTTCPEKVIRLEPRLNFTDDARRTIRLNEAEPFSCIRCGKPFGVQQTVDRIASQLAGKHHMFARSDQVERISMCDDCRVVVEFASDDAPFKMAPRPVPRTTEDDLRERELARQKAPGNGSDET